MDSILVALFTLLVLACLLLIFMQVRATYTPHPRKNQILRSILAGFELNLGLISGYFLKSLIQSGSLETTGTGILSFEMGALLIQLLFTLMLYGVFAFRAYARKHYAAWDLEHSEEKKEDGE